MAVRGEEQGSTGKPRWVNSDRVCQVLIRGGVG